MHGFFIKSRAGDASLSHSQSDVAWQVAKATFPVIASLLATVNGSNCSNYTRRVRLGVLSRPLNGLITLRSKGNPYNL